MTGTIAETSDAREAELSSSANPAWEETLVSGDGHLAPPSLALDIPPRGAEVGRYVVLTMLGAGAMGVVLAAYDPRLDRKVALKLLKRRAGANEDAARARLQREAQALAKLSHSNVVGVHDVGVHEGQVFVAMEFVEGQTLGDWLKAEARSWQEIVPIFEAAGRGLAAAHAQGLIHRDFKPDNVMIDEAGRVRVMDFGLARSEELDRSEPIDLDDAALRDQSTLETPLTMTGAMLGTPAYMSPEQFMGTEVTARSDQFGFCVALFEALHGARPFTGATLAEVAFQVSEGEIVEPPRRAGVVSPPAWLREVTRRGLSSDPSLRFAHMQDVVLALGRGDARRRQRRRVWIGAGLAVVLLALVGARRWRSAQTKRGCAADGQAAAGAWDGPLRERVRTALTADKVAYAEQTADRVVEYLDTHADQLRATRRDACLEARVRHSIDEPTLDRVTWCLEQQQLQMQMLVEQLTTGDPDVSPYAVAAAARLGPANQCADASRLGGLGEAPQDMAAARRIASDLASAGALEAVARPEAAERLARSAVRNAQALGSPALHAGALFRLGTALNASGRYDEAEQEHEAAYFEAHRATALDVAADAATALAKLTGYTRQDKRAGLRWAQHARLALDLGSEPELSLRRAALEASLGATHDAAGDIDLATTHQARALEMNRARLGDRHPGVASAMNNLASLLEAAGQLDEAQALHLEALDIKTKSLGPNHPSVAMSLSNLGNIHYARGEFAQARDLYTRAVQVREAANQGTHAKIAIQLNNLGGAQLELGEFEAAGISFARALAIREAALGPDHPKLSYSLEGLADVSLRLGRPSAAIDLAQRALGLHAAQAVSSPRLAGIHLLLVQALWDAPPGQGQDRPRARALATRTRDALLEADTSATEAFDTWLAQHPSPGPAPPSQLP